MRRLRIASLLLVATACNCGGGTNPPPPKDPPQVFLTVENGNVVGTQISMTVTVNGCDNVALLEMFEHGAPLKRVPWGGNPTTVTLVSGDFERLYATLGFAADLVLTAKATCDDTRANTSLPAAARFFPVASVTPPQPGNQLAVPDAFIAEGGSGSTPVTFVGCISTGSTTTALVRTDTNGQVLGSNTQLPFNCSYSSVITDRNLASDTRWLFEPGVGAFCFDHNLNITAVVTGNVKQIGIGRDGDAIISSSEIGLFRAAHDQNLIKWKQSPAGVLAGSPVYRQNLDDVVLPTFEDQLGQSFGNVVVENRAYADGHLIGSTQLTTINYGFLNSPAIPPMTISDDGAIVYFPYQPNGANTDQVSVLACATNTTGCNGAARKWSSPALAGEILGVVLYANGSIVAAAGANNLYFLDATTGGAINFASKSISPTAPLVAMGLQQGHGRDFYMLNGPAGGYPTELVGVDSPESGELIRYGMEGGQTPFNALTIAIDDSGAPWLRIGPNLVKPLTLADYRSTKGANQP